RLWSTGCESANQACQMTRAGRGLYSGARLLPAPRSPARMAPMSEQRVTPQLRMTNWGRSRAFYVDGLGFTVDWTHQFEPNFPVFAAVSRDGITLFLTEHTGDCKPGGACYIILDDVDAFYGDITARGIKAREAPED